MKRILMASLATITVCTAQVYQESGGLVVMEVGERPQQPRPRRRHQQTERRLRLHPDDAGAEVQEVEVTLTARSPVPASQFVRVIAAE